MSKERLSFQLLYNDTLKGKLREMPQKKLDFHYLSSCLHYKLNDQFQTLEVGAKVESTPGDVTSKAERDRHRMLTVLSSLLLSDKIVIKSDFLSLLSVHPLKDSILR